MDEGSSYYGYGTEIKSVSDAAKSTNVVMTSAGERWNLLEKECRIEDETEIFGRQAGHYGLSGMVEERC